jgi:hypothetical protein
MGEEREQNPGNSGRGVDGNSGAGAGMDGTVMRWRGKAWRKTRLFAIQIGVMTRAGT